MATQTTLTASKAWRPDQSIFNPAEVVPDALILQHSTVAGVIEGDAPALRVAYVTDDTAQFTAEAAEIPEANPTLDEVLVYTAKITQLVRLSQEQYHQQGTAGELSLSVQRAITKKGNEAFLTQPKPTGSNTAPPAGILNIPGIVQGDPITANLDPLIDLVAGLESNGGTPTGILLDPLAWAALRKIKTGTGAQTALLGAGTNDSVKMLLDLPVTVTSALSANSGIVLDSSAIASAVGPVKVATDESIYFTSDSVALRATWRIGWNVVKANRIGKFSLTSE
ncbi:phage major capsid protein [Leucobacter sp. G161]|uniref:phage major capsid protein n=1 Tax=Leucobacter sp. G161 TaxID=663704 RepID=UPI00073C9DA4|nr:phage major capsid protein [Leucobacter sp. G161]KUF06766.1 major capsid protein [Leucobacter sp. G161]